MDLLIIYFFPFTLVFIVVASITGLKAFNFNYKSGIIRSSIGLICIVGPTILLSLHGIEIRGDPFNWLVSIFLAGILLVPIGIIELIGTKMKES